MASTSRPTTACYIGIGSNVGDRRRFIYRAIELLRKTEGIKIKCVSSIYETRSVSEVPQGQFLNGVLEIDTTLGAMDLLKGLNGIENILGRRRDVENGPRTIDLDILYYGAHRIVNDKLIIPHPRIRERQFVLKGLRELGKTA